MLVNLGHRDREITDLIEIQEGSRTDSVSSRWGVDQFTWPKHRYLFAVYHSDPRLLHTGADEDIARMLKDLLNRYENVSVPNEPDRAVSFADAFSRARSNGSEYFLILHPVETDREFSLGASLYLSRTGTLLSEMRSSRSGNDRVRTVINDLAARIHGMMPIRGRLIDRRFEKGLIDLGAADGIEAGMKLSILRDGSLRLSPEKPGFVVEQAGLLGELTVTRVDELVAEGTVARAGFFDRINTGDAVILAPAEPDTPAGTAEAEVAPEIYRRLREIR